MRSFRVATYNIHKCVGMDRRYMPERIVEVLRETEADVIALQEVLAHSGSSHRDHQAEFIAHELGMECRMGENRRINGGKYGNVTLSRFPVGWHCNHDITIKRYEPRGCLHVEIDIDGVGPVHFVNLHMGTSFFERRRQVHKILSTHVLESPEFSGRLIVAGDFNEWLTGDTTRLFRSRFKSVDARLHLGRSRTFPGIFPIVHLDHIYYDDAFMLKRARLHRSKKALMASDHLPIVADFELRS